MDCYAERGALGEPKILGIQPRVGRDCKDTPVVKSLRSSYTGLCPQKDRPTNPPVGTLTHTTIQTLARVIAQEKHTRHKKYCQGQIMALARAILQGACDTPD